MLIIILNALQIAIEYQRKDNETFKKKKTIPHTELKKDAGNRIKRDC